jgi:hypothetical protein
MKPHDKLPSAPAGGRKKYQRPEIRRYGSVRAITQNVGMMGMIDGGGKNPKTGV